MYNYLSLFVMTTCCVTCGLGQRTGNPDDTAIIERPCPTYDQNCIRDFFASHAHCKKTFGPAPDPYIRPQAQYFLSRINMTLNVFDQYVRGLNGRIEEFYINKDTDKLVIAVEFRNLNQTTNSAYFRFHRRAKEPVVTASYATVQYQSVIITAVIPKIDDLELKRAVCTAFVNAAVPPYAIGQSALASNDPQVQQTIADFAANLPTDVQELFLTDAAFYIANYIQYNICDFGLTVL